jgi:integrase/recombinase XerC
MFIERFIQFLQFEKRFSPFTIGAYHTDLQQFSDFTSQQQLTFSEINQAHVRSFVIDLVESGLDPRSINRKISTLKSFYKFLLREGLASKNPMTNIRSLKVSKRLPVVVEEDKLSKLLDSDTLFSDDFPGLRDLLVMELLFGTGIRLAELLMLKEVDVDKWNKSICVLGKRSKQRIIPVSNSLINLIEIYIAKKSSVFAKGEGYLVVTNKGEAGYPNFIRRIVTRYLSYISTQTQKSPHVLRHTYATSLLNRGADLNAIKELLGHSSLAATQVYTHNSVERLKLIYKQAHPKA